jgi:hypothetical protein
MSLNFRPDTTIRSFKTSDLIGKFAEIHLRELSKDKTLQWIVVRNPANCDWISGCAWVKIYGKPGTTIKRKIINAYLIEHQNGGRSDYGLYDSYKSFFNAARKAAVIRHWTCGLMGRISHKGNPDQADIVLKFKDFEINCSCYVFTAPEEWYSDYYKDMPKFRFTDSELYADINTAVKAIKNKHHDDIFGERYFPVLVFPKKTKQNLYDIVSRAKAHSKPIVTKEHIIFGVRCKPDEVNEIIEQTYEAQGHVAINSQWDWEQ